MTTNLNLNEFGEIYNCSPDNAKINGTISESLTDIDEILKSVDDVCKRIREQENNYYEQTNKL